MPQATIHPSALVAPDADLGDDVIIGPYAIVEPGVIIGPRTRVDAHAILRTGTRLGAANEIHPFAILGGAPQDRRHAGEPTTLEIGDRNIFREHVTVHRGTAHGGGVTRIGSDGLFMVGVHIAHDALVGDAVILANNTLLAGHVHLGDHVVTGGHVAIAPFVHIGERAFLAGGAMVERPIPPFVIAAGNRAVVRALNKVGLRRTAVPPTSITALERAYRTIFRTPTPRAVAAAALQNDPDPFVRTLAQACI